MIFQRAKTCAINPQSLAFNIVMQFIEKLIATAAEYNV